jgi:hypothetical protein
MLMKVEAPVKTAGITAAYFERMSNKRVFLFLWVVTFVLYLPAAGSGKVGDYYLEWLDVIRTHDAWFFISARYLPSLYSFTQAFMYGFYKLAGPEPLPWHVLAVTVHVTNAFLLYLIFKRLLTDCRVKYASVAAFGCALLFCVSPYNTEVIVHEPCFHYTIGLCFLLLITWLAQRFHQAPKGMYAWQAAGLFLLSCFSIEIFYVTPIFVLSLAVFYRFVLKYDRHIFRKAIAYFVAPQAILFGFHLLLLHHHTHHFVGHKLTGQIDNIGIAFLTNGARYLYHIIFLGRLLPGNIKAHAYGFIDSKKGMAVFCAAIVAAYAYLVLRLKKTPVNTALTMLILTWMLLCALIVAPREFPDIKYVTYDRYTYFMMPFVYMLLILALMHISSKTTGMVLFTGYAVLNLCFLCKINNYWYHSEKIVRNLVKTFPDTHNKTVLLLNPPENMNGVLMIGSKPSSAFRLMYEYEGSKKVTAPEIIDIASFSMRRPGDGAHVTVINDSMLNVTLNQAGDKWWQFYRTAGSYDCDLYKLNMADTSRWYQLTLKKPASQYLLLFVTGENWRTVDWHRKNVDQY